MAATRALQAVAKLSPKILLRFAHPSERRNYESKRLSNEMLSGIFTTP
jgi:hypothetical protein